jgi:intracellular sulfur oxidation DsrE/DsrF family protein
MNGQVSLSSLERRSFLSRLSAGAAAFAATFAGGAATAYGQNANATSWVPIRHEKDDWMDKVPGKHRMVFDTTTPETLGNALGYANNFVRVNRNDYGLQNSDVAVIIIVRAGSTGFGYKDAIWEKWGDVISKRANFVDPKTKGPAKANLYNIADYVAPLPNRNNTLDSLFKMGVQLAVCATATRGIAGAIHDATGGNTDDIFNELVSNLISTTNARTVPAGIVAVNRAQERGYTFVG